MNKQDEVMKGIDNLLDMNLRVIEGYYRMLFIMDAFTSLMVKKELITEEELMEEFDKITAEVKKQQEEALGTDLDNLRKAVNFDKAFGGKVGDA